MRRTCVALVATLMVPAALAADPIEVRTKQVGPDRYELALELPADVDPRQASSLLLPVAEQLCAGRPAQLGHYRFEAQAPLAPAGTDTAATQAFVQQVACGPSSEVVHVARAPKTPPTAQDEQAIRADTLRYLAAKDRGDSMPHTRCWVPRWSRCSRMGAPGPRAPTSTPRPASPTTERWCA